METLEGCACTMSSPSRRKSQLCRIPASLLLLLLLLAAAGVSSHTGPTSDGSVVANKNMENKAFVDFHTSSSHETQAGGRGSQARVCTVDDLLPPHNLHKHHVDDLSKMWDHTSMVDAPPFDCTCSTLKASYFCPNLGKDGYPMWNPWSAANGKCKVKRRSSLRHEPLPPGFRLLIYGNSHLRQVVEGIVCAFFQTIQVRQVTLVDPYSMAEHELIVDNDLQCRSCVYNQKSMGELLFRNKCISEEAIDEACSCEDNRSIFEFDNGAIIHYHFAHVEGNKSFEDALTARGTDYSFYDAVVANPGNEPRMEVAEVLRGAKQLKDEGVSLFWMSVYEGEGDVGTWLPEEQAEFWDSGARYLPVHRMVESLQYLTRGEVEGETNPHFCMPGPPSEIGIMLLTMAWSMHEERAEATRVHDANRD